MQVAQLPAMCDTAGVSLLDLLREDCPIELWAELDRELAKRRALKKRVECKLFLLGCLNGLLYGLLFEAF